LDQSFDLIEWVLITGMFGELESFAQTSLGIEGLSFFVSFFLSFCLSLLLCFSLSSFILE